MTTTMLSSEQAVAQSLALGPLGAGLLRIEQALAGGAWHDAHEQIQQALAGPVDAATHTGLYYGAPAITFVLHTAMVDGRLRYRQATTVLDRHVQLLAHQRAATATDRIRHRQTAAFHEYDLFYGLVGLGALLLHYMPDSNALVDVLHYLVRLTEPWREDGVLLPGWWVAHDPDPKLPTPGGHANLGMAHGAAGILALLALATRHGRRVNGQPEAIARLCAWFDTWRQDTDQGPWWPQWVTRDELRTGRCTQPGPGRPSWCYGTPGIARAQHIAAITTNDPTRRDMAEHALASCMTRQQLVRLTDPGLCHGAAGLYQTAYRAAHDAATPTIEQRLPDVQAVLRRLAANQNTGNGLLTGRAGTDLALETTRHPPQSGWDTCLLLT